MFSLPLDTCLGWFPECIASILIPSHAGKALLTPWPWKFLHKHCHGDTAAFSSPVIPSGWNTPCLCNYWPCQPLWAFSEVFEFPFPQYFLPFCFWLLQGTSLKSRVVSNGASFRQLHLPQMVFCIPPGLVTIREPHDLSLPRIRQHVTLYWDSS